MIGKLQLGQQGTVSKEPSLNMHQCFQNQNQESVKLAVLQEMCPWCGRPLDTAPDL